MLLLNKIKRQAGDARLHTEFSFVLNVKHFLSLFIVLPFPISCNVLLLLTKTLVEISFLSLFLLLRLSHRTPYEWLIFFFYFFQNLILGIQHTKKKKKQTNHRDESRINLLLNGECLGRDV
jgi:hypothetical protein